MTKCAPPPISLTNTANALPFTVTAPTAQRDAVRAGADSVEHATDMDDETIADMVRRGTFYVPTIDHNRYYVDNYVAVRMDARNSRWLE